MNRKVAFALAAVAALALSYGPANAGGRHKDKNTKAVMTATEIGVGAAATAGYFAFNNWNWKWDSSRAGITSIGAMVGTTIGCAALSPFVASAALERPLTYREAHILIGACVIPVIGGWLVDEAYRHHVLWAPDEAPAGPKKKWKRHARK
jgi:hypothetical protein